MNIPPLILILSLILLQLLTPTTSMSMSTKALVSRRIIRVAEPVWRTAAAQHADAIHSLLLPGMTPVSHVLNCGKKRPANNSNKIDDRWTALDPLHPVYNFLIEYYGLKGTKGPRRLARWSPSPLLILADTDNDNDPSRLQTIHQLIGASESAAAKLTITVTDTHDSIRQGGILLEGANQNDMGTTLHLKGAMPTADGVIYSPFSFFHQPNIAPPINTAANPFLWYRSVMQQTMLNEPILHCHGLHEWAMQYHPPGANPPPSQKYQAYLPLRVSQQVLNAVVERRGISCTHVDALRYFAPAAGPLNHHGSALERTDQLRMEQPACVHAHMDLLKHVLRLGPHCDATLIQRVLRLALDARMLDVAASPYDAQAFHVAVIPIETKAGRALYRQEQQRLMEQAEPVRQDVLQAYNAFIALAFGNDVYQQSAPDPERFARAEPGGLPWRKNLI